LPAKLTIRPSSLADCGPRFDFYRLRTAPRPIPITSIIIVIVVVIIFVVVGSVDDSK